MDLCYNMHGNDELREDDGRSDGGLQMIYKERRGYNEIRV